MSRPLYRAARPGVCLRGLYAITDSDIAAGAALADKVAQVLAGGAAVIQYRDKGNDAARREAEARQLLSLCRRYNVPLIINDDVALALAVGADGVHLGREDLALNEARRLLGRQSIIGISCYNALECALAAQQAGADYVAFGRFFPSVTKPSAAQANIETLIQARQQLHIPIVAIGGITPENAPRLITAGADMIAVVQGVFGQADPQTAAQGYAQLFK